MTDQENNQYRHHHSFVRRRKRRSATPQKKTSDITTPIQEEVEEPTPIDVEEESVTESEEVDTVDEAEEILYEDEWQDEMEEELSTPAVPKEHINWRPLWTHYLIPTAIIAALVTLWILKPEPYIDPYPTAPWENRTPYRYRGSFNRDFNDLNDVQLAMARRIGVEPAATREVLSGRRNLVEIGHSDNYRIDDLTHSVAVLVPEAAELLEEIGLRFRTKLEQDTLPIYIPIVTSVTRTGEDIADLSRGNVNASANSTHRYGTTFDISWKRYYKVNPHDPRDIPNEELKHLLAIVLKGLHKEDRCYVMHERRQACFHITARR